MSTDASLGDYVEVPERIAEFREKHPEGCLRPVDSEQPYTVERIKIDDVERCFIVYTAAAYRSPDDERPGIGCAWEPFPGQTEYTRNSELMNAETSAWGRAIVAVLAADAKRGIATGDDIRNRRAEQQLEREKPQQQPKQQPKTSRQQQGSVPKKATGNQVRFIKDLKRALEISDEAFATTLLQEFGAQKPEELDSEKAKALIDRMKRARDTKRREEKAAAAAAKKEQDAAAEAVPAAEEGGAK